MFSGPCHLHLAGRGQLWILYLAQGQTSMFERRISGLQVKTNSALFETRDPEDPVWKELEGSGDKLLVERRVWMDGQPTLFLKS